MNDILAEVDRQRNSLKRQAGKARRYIELRNRMREILSAVFSTRAEMLVDQQERVEISLALMGGEGKTSGTGNRALERTRSPATNRSRRPTSARSKKCATDGRMSNWNTRRPFSASSACRIRFETLEERKTALAAEKTRDIAKNSSETRRERDRARQQLAGIELEKETVANQIQSTQRGPV